MWSKRSAGSLGGTLGWLGLCVAVGHAIGGGLARADSKPAKPDPAAAGYEIFNREWIPNDPRSHGGDGLGPVYNDSSCVACHNAGGSGGAGPISKNIEILSAAWKFTLGFNVPGRGLDAGQGQSAGLVVLQLAALSQLSPIGAASPAAASQQLDPLLAIHAGFRTSRVVVLHKFGTDPNYTSWRDQALNPPGTPNPNAAPVPPSPLVGTPGAGTGTSNRDSAFDRAEARIPRIRSAVLARSADSRQSLTVGPFQVTRSQRNPSPLFGLGLIDAIPNEAIEAMAKQQAKESSGSAGRVSRLKDGRIGRLGWKGQTATVADFVLNACAVELGLEVPGHPQAVIPQAPRYRTTGPDLTAKECEDLVAYVRSLPRPIERRPSGPAEAKHLEAGKAAFARIGCARCHAPKVGEVQGIYSDLLLHDMGQDTADDGSYDGSGADDGSEDPLVPQNSGDMARAEPGLRPVTPTPRGASQREWRTPPLWGFRDSGPYLHDGRAQTLEEAVALHGGQGVFAARKFFELAPGERLQIEAFLKSLIAPPSIQVAQRGE